MEGYRSEVNLRALDWLEDVSRRLKRGWIITIDYGYERECDKDSAGARSAPLCVVLDHGGSDQSGILAMSVPTHK